MINPLRWTFVAVLIAGPNFAKAATVDVDYSATVISVVTTGDQSLLSSLTAGFAPGVVLNGAFSYDDDAVGRSFGSTSTFVSEAPTQLIFESGATAFAAPGFQILLNDDTFSGGDRFELRATTVDGSFQDGVITSQNLRLVDRSGDLFSTQDLLPSALALSDFNGNGLTLQVIETQDSDFIGTVTIRALITELSSGDDAAPPAAVPVPPAGGMLLALLAGLGWVARRRSGKVNET